MPIKRAKDVKGFWRYDDEDEGLFAFVALPTYSIESIDDFIQGLQCVQVDAGGGKTSDGVAVRLDDSVQAALLEKRDAAFSAYKTADFDLMMAWLDALHWACRSYGMQEAARPEVLVARRQRQANRGNAKKPRGSIKFDGESFSINSIIKKLACRLDELGDFLPPSQLWGELISELDGRRLEPDERNDCITYHKNDEGDRARLTRASFGSMLSKARKKIRQLSAAKL
ncbi:hypothetical protein [Candidatus Accumulibacter sp. ACC007]|uniref:hypothetical protein n=1 Tax=Candidatus Accumulibacter sp. ACC007 TaxID=2823333 RepID=UPI0025BBA892|nr:hypothetical protein [Candidatus Accumulibacter sp. ACC007]